MIAISNDRLARVTGGTADRGLTIARWVSVAVVSGLLGGAAWWGSTQPRPAQPARGDAR